jgi:hypothetical protein
VVLGQWQDDVEQPARMLLPPLWGEVFQQVSMLVAPEMTAVAGQPVQMLPLPETQQALLEQTGRHIAAVTSTTLLGLRHLFRSGRLAGLSLAAQAHRVQQALGLTPAQIRQLGQAQARWQQDGRSAAAMQTATEEAVARGLSHRLRGIAQTQAYAAVNLGQRQAMTQAAQTGPQGIMGVRRYWYLGPRPCDICRAIPGMNPQGVALDERFHTPDGPVMDPPMHPACMCGADYGQRG